MTPEQAKALREPFPKSAIGKMPKAGMQLDYVGHAAVTQRLLEVDPTWTWEPAGQTPDGLPAFDERGGLWIRLTVCGVTRYGYGEAMGSDPFDKVKGAIGNAIRNAAMRFGVALDLWSKEEISTTFEHPRPVASDKQIAKWTAAIAAAPDWPRLKSVGDEISGYALPDSTREELLAIFAARREELHA